MSLNDQLAQFLASKSCNLNGDVINQGTLPNSMFPAAIANQFIDNTVNQSVLLQRVTTLRVDACSGKIPKLDLVGPVSHGASAISCPNTTLPTELTLHYELVKYRSYFALDGDFVQCNLEKEGIRNTLLNMFQKGIANDSEIAAIQSDSSLMTGDNQSRVNNLLGVNDGWMKQICSCIPECNVLDAAGAAPSAKLYHEALRKIPSRFRSMQRDYRFMAGHAVADHWGYYWSNRITNGGDSALATGDVPGPWGVNFLPVPLWPEMIPYGSSATPVTHIVLTPPSNLVYIIGRNLRMEQDRQPKCDVDEYIMHWSADYLVLDASKVVLIKNVDICGEAYDGCSNGCGTADDHDACPSE